jgi:LacI family transcriptional regulator
VPQAKNRLMSAAALSARGSTSLQDVARAAGVSMSTASRALNGHVTVAEPLRQRVERVARDMSYVPHASARALASKRTMRVACLLPTIDNTIFAQFSEALQRHIRAEHYGMMVAVTDFDQANEARAIREVVGAGIDGLALVGATRDPDLYAYLTDRRVPFLLTSIYAPQVEHVQVGYDNAGGARTLTTYLIELGHRRIAAIDGPVSDNDRAAARFRGVREALELQGLSMPPEAMVERRFTISDGRTGLRAILAQYPGVTAIVCGNDILAIGALLEARAMGRRIPEDLSIAGFDDLDLASQLEVGLTTIRVPNREMGEVAGATLLAMIAGRTPPPITLLPTALILRGSTCPPRTALTMPI